MPNASHIVELDIRLGGSAGGRWIKESSGKDYYYKYTGGGHRDDNGTVEHKVGQGQAAVTVNLIADPRYHFDTVSFENDHATEKQLSQAGNGGRQRTITNKCTQGMDAAYKIKVIDTGTDGKGNRTICCDPSIRNIPA